MPELLAPWKETLMGRILTAGYLLLPFDFSAAPGLLELPAFWVGLPQLMAPYLERSTF
jgi:hypothetical protein